MAACATHDHFLCYEKPFYYFFIWADEEAAHIKGAIDGRSLLFCLLGREFLSQPVINLLDTPTLG